MVNIADGEVGILDDLVERSLGAIQQILGDLLELGAGQGLVQEQWVLIGVNRDVRQIDIGLLGGGQLNLCLLCSLAQTLHGALILGQVNALGGLEAVYQPVNDALIPVIAAQLVIAGGCHNLNHAIADFQQGDVEGAATQVKYQDGLLLLALFQAISQSGCGWLVDNTEHVQACNLASFLGGLALCVLEVCRNGNNGVSNILTEVSLCVALQLHQRASGNLLGGVILIINVDLPVGADVALDGANGAVNIGYRLVLSGLADQDFAVLCKSNDGRRGAGTLRVCDNGGLATLQYGNDRVRRTQVNTYCASHDFFSFYLGVINKVDCQ